MSENRDFLRKIVEDDLRRGRYREIVTRFPPEPNGFPHIGHAKSISINFGIARDYGGRCNLRMDDTNPTTEETKYVEALKDAVEWLGFEWSGDVRYASDYFHQLYRYATELIKMGKAYVDSLNEEEIREYRGTVTEAGKRSKYADRSVKENLELFEKMKNGEFEEGEHILRAKIDMASPNMKMRDPLLYRIRHSSHHRTGDRWAIYPMYDFAHCLSDYIEGISHSFCTLEFENNREIYDWVLESLNLKPPRPHQYEFARLNLNYTMMSKRKLKELVDKRLVSGWDDPRMPTIAGLRRRGYTPESILNFCEQIGIAKANSTVDVSQLEFSIRDDLNLKVPRVMCVLKPLKITIENYRGEEEIDAPYYPHDVPKDGSRKLPFSRDIYINREDFSENPPRDYFRLTPNQPVRLRYAYIIRCKEVIKDRDGNILEIKAEYHPNSKSGEDRSGIKVKSAIQWVELKSAKRVEVRLYDRLFNVENPQNVDELNPNSLKIVKNALIEPAVIIEKPDVRFQFEREGYFYADPIDYSDERPVFNRVVSLKDSWVKKVKKVKRVKESTKREERPKGRIEKADVEVEGKANSQKSRKRRGGKHRDRDRNRDRDRDSGEMATLNREEETIFNTLKERYGLNGQVANILARDRKLLGFFDEAVEELNAPITIANIVTNEVAKELKEKEIDELKFSPKEIAQLSKMVDDEVISNRIAKQVYEEMVKSGENPLSIVESRDLKQISTPETLLPVIYKVISNHPKNLEKYRCGNRGLFGFFVGEVLKATDGKANPKVVSELMKKILDSNGDM